MILKNFSELIPKKDGVPRTLVVGSGATGLYAAVELSKHGHEVVLIETGGNALDNFDQSSYESIGREHEGIHLGRSKSLGGTTNLWGGQLVEFQPIDFSGREWLPDSKWPVTYEEIAPYYRPTYQNLGIPELFHSDDSVLRQVKGRTPQFENGVEFFLTRWLKIPNFAVAYQKEIASSENIFVLLHHTIRGFSGSDGHIQGASLTDSNGTLHFVESDQTILAAGTIEISRLLLQSAASSDWDCPWKNNRNPGTFFQDHLGGRVASVHPIDRTKFFNTFSTIVRSNHKFQPKLRLTNTTIAENPVLNIQGMFSFESSVSENLVFLKQFLKAAVFSRKIEGISGLFSNLIACGRHLFPLMWKYVIQNRIFVPGTSKISFTIQSEQTPVAESRITLAHGTTDSNGLPKLLLDWRIGTAELTSIRNFTERCQLALREAGLAELEIIEELDSLKPAFLDTLTDNYHLVGGARMGHSAEDGVVDRNLRVFGTNNLYVAGAATFCTTSNANTTFVALAFVTRLVEQLTSPAAPPGERPFTA